MPTFTYDGFKIAYEQRGRRQGAAARPIVLIHGLLLPRKHHYPLADALADRGNRVLLIDLLGHGESDQPRHSRFYSMEIFGRQVVGLLDHLDVPEAVIGGTSLGANVTLEVAVHAPDRTRGLFIEMPVLERAAPAAAVLFVPLTIAYAEAATPMQYVAELVRRVPRGLSLYGDVLLDVLSREPIPSAAVLHGLLTGRMAPHPNDREKIGAPTLIMGHERDLLHPLSDASALHRELANSELIQANSFFELRFPPNRLSDLIADFLDEVWSLRDQGPTRSNAVRSPCRCPSSLGGDPMKLYAELPYVRVRQLAADVGTSLWIFVWVAVGSVTHDLVMELAAPGVSLEEAGARLADELRSAGDAAGSVPALGETLRAPFVAAGDAARAIERAGVAQQEAVADVALWLGFLLAAIPILYVLWRYLPWRTRWIRDASAASRLKIDAEDLELFALRAVATRPLHELRRATPDPARALATRDFEPLAALELRALGLKI